MARAYTRRMFAGVTPVERVDRFVPAGVRWVLRNVEAYSNAPTRCVIQGNLAGLLIVETVAVGSVGAQGSWEGRVVFYGGEAYSISSDTPGCQMILTVYEFGDTSPPPAADVKPGEAETRAAEQLAWSLSPDP